AVHRSVQKVEEHRAGVLLVDRLPERIESQEGWHQGPAKVAGGGIVHGRPEDGGEAENGQANLGMFLAEGGQLPFDFQPVGDEAASRRSVELRRPWSARSR